MLRQDETDRSRMRGKIVQKGRHVNKEDVVVNAALGMSLGLCDGRIVNVAAAVRRRKWRIPLLLTRQARTGQAAMNTAVRHSLDIQGVRFVVLAPLGPVIVRRRVG